MTDKELLKYAAKAAGIKIKGFYQDGYAFDSNGDSWNPLLDDGDALRLAVKLRLAVEQMRISGGLACVCTNVDTEEDIRELYILHGDAFEATRRAITRSAAEIGRAAAQP